MTTADKRQYLGLRENYLQPGLMKDHGQQARDSDNFAGPLDFETPRPDLPVHFLNWLSRASES